MITTKMFNKYAAQNQTLLQKALTTATGVGEGLIPENLEQIVTNTIIRLSPELAMIEQKKISGKIHEYNRLTALPAIGGAMGESATTATTQSATARANVTLKIIRRKGAVTNFMQDTSEENIDAAAYEMENHLTAHVYDLVNYLYYGNETANRYEFSGLDYYIGRNDGTTTPVNRTNQIQFGVTPANLKMLDDMIDESNSHGARAHRRAFVMSPQMLSLVSRLLTNVRLNQDNVGQGLSIVEIPGGWRLMSYRGIPIIETSSMRNTDTMSAVTPTTNTAGGTIADDTYYFKIAKITQKGESLAIAATQVAGGGDNSIITLTWVDNADAYRYKIYCGTVFNSEVLVSEVSANIYDATGTVGVRATTVTFSTTPSTVNPTISAPAGMLLAISGATQIPTQMRSDIAYEQAAGHSVPETIVLWDLDPIQGLGKVPYTNSAGSQFNGLVTTRELAETDDFTQFLVKSYMALTDAWDATSYWARGYRVS